MSKANLKNKLHIHVMKIGSKKEITVEELKDIITNFYKEINIEPTIDDLENAIDKYYYLCKSEEKDNVDTDISELYPVVGKIDIPEIRKYKKSTNESFIEGFKKRLGEFFDIDETESYQPTNKLNTSNPPTNDDDH